MFELLRWSEGYFRFEEGAPCHAAVEAPVRFPTEALLMEAARRIDEWSRIGSKVSHLRLVPRLPRARGAGHRPARPGAVRVGGARRGGRRPRSPLARRGARPLRVRGGADRVRAHQRRHRRARRSRRTPARRPSRAATWRRCWCRPARPWRTGSTTSRPARSRSCCGPIRSCRRRGGCSGSATPRWAAIARRSTAGSSWSRLDTRTPGEEAESPSVERLRQSVETILKELERYRD